MLLCSSVRPMSVCAMSSVSQKIFIFMKNSAKLPLHLLKLEFNGSSKLFFHSSFYKTKWIRVSFPPVSPVSPPLTSFTDSKDFVSSGAGISNEKRESLMEEGRCKI